MEESKNPIQRLIVEFRKLPGIGPKSAQRLVFHLLKQPKESSLLLAEAIGELKDKLTLCSQCNDLTDIDPCRLCQDSRRDRRLICVVEEPFNILSIEKSGGYRGLYHVLHGAISPIDGIGPDQLRLKNLLKRIAEGGVEELIVATNPTTEGEATAIYLSRLMSPLEVKVSRIALGIPIGSDIEFADGLTISRALSGRSAMEDG
jgi:recombination protein RecR